MFLNRVNGSPHGEWKKRGKWRVNVTFAESLRNFVCVLYLRDVSPWLLIFYVGQTSNKFSIRWSAHRSNWNEQDCKTDSDKDQMASSRHYSENHGTINKPPLHEAYTVTFVEQPSCHSLDICENKWYHLIDAQINIQNMILPHVK